MALDNMNKFKDIDEYVKITLDKLPEILADLIMLEDDWQSLGISGLFEALRKWAELNPKKFIPLEKILIGMICNIPEKWTRNLSLCLL